MTTTTDSRSRTETVTEAVIVTETVAAATAVATATAAGPAEVARTAAPRRVRRSLRALRSAAAVVLLTALLLAVGALVVVPRVAGWVPLTVLTGSMEPTIPTGSQVIAAPVVGEAEAARLQVGDIITVMPYPEDPTLVTHRIVERTDSAAGVSFVTQGDANGAVDDWQVDATQIRAEVKYWVPGAGYVATALDGRQKSLSIAVVAGALLLYAAGQVVGAIRARGRATDA